MGNWFKEGSGSASGDYIGKDERAVLRANKVPFPILKVVYVAESQYGPKFEIETVLPGSEDKRVLSFSAESVPNRAEGLRRVIEAQDDGTYTPITVRMENDGNATVLVSTE